MNKYFIVAAISFFVGSIIAVLLCEWITNGIPLGILVPAVRQIFPEETIGMMAIIVVSYTTCLVAIIKGMRIEVLMLIAGLALIVVILVSIVIKRRR